MEILSHDNILKILIAFNPWWKTGVVRPEFAKTFKRFAYYEALKILTNEDIRRTIILTGMRRVGKTTIQYQVIDYLLKSGIMPNRIVYISLDHPLFKLCELNDILDCYHTNIYMDEDCYYFLDEVQYATDWDQWIKTIYDTRPLSRMMATGSASPILRKKAAESGVGRWTVIQIPTLSFFEYCGMLDIEKPEIPPEIKPTELVRCEKRELTLLMTRISGLQKHFNRYLSVGGFPEFVMMGDNVLAQAIMREDIVDKVLKRDIPVLYNIRNITELEKIFLYLCYCSSGIISVEAIAKELGGISRATVDDYIAYMESSGLIYRSYPINMSGKQVLKAKAKIYIADAAIRNAVLMDDNMLFDPVQQGIAVETAVYKHVYSYYNKNATSVGYYRDAKKGNEIDIVVDNHGSRILIEVKYRQTTSISENDAIYQWADNATGAIVVTKREDDYGAQPSAGKNKIMRIPAFAFMYLLGGLR